MTQPIPIHMVHHIARETTDVVRCTTFYREVLGFRQIERPNFDFAGAWLFNYGVQIHVIEGRPPERGGPISTRADHVAFHTEDLATVERRLQEHGIPFRNNISPATGIRQLFFHDPDGNHIEIGTYPPTPREIGVQPASQNE